MRRGGCPGEWCSIQTDARRRWLAAHLGTLAVIAIDLPQFTDGRGYSIARLLGERFGFKGEIRAVGDVLRDNLFYLSRCGFDAFVLGNQDNLQDALEHLSDFSDGYQTSVERPRPLFRRRVTPPSVRAEISLPARTRQRTRTTAATIRQSKSS